MQTGKSPTPDCTIITCIGTIFALNPEEAIHKYYRANMHLISHYPGSLPRLHAEEDTLVGDVLNHFKKG